MDSPASITPAISFNWKVARSGYVWADMKGGRFLRATDCLKPDWTFGLYERDYQPLEQRTGLFREFAELELSENTVVAFANRFGMLGAEQGRSEETEFGPVPIRAETLGVWKREIENLKRAVHLWDVVRSGDQSKLAEVKAARPGGELPIAVQEFLHLTDPDPAMSLVAEIRILADAQISNHLVSKVLFAGNTPRLQLTLVPRNLLGAMWLQFATAVHGFKTFPECLQCGAPFEISRDLTGKKKGAQFCSTRCRVSHYRNRVERARQLGRDGKSPQQIARELRTEVRTVRVWLNPNPARAKR
jgi:hypothetical protein